MHFQYPDTSCWQEWQREYQFGALYIFPPAGIIETIDELRQAFDPQTAAICQAHISLSEPLRMPLSGDKLQEIQAALSMIDPFNIHYGPLNVHSPYPGIAFAIEPIDLFMQLRARIHATSIFQNGRFEREHILPHMTIAEFISLERSFELLRELSGRVPEGDFVCSSVEYAIPTASFFFERVLTLSLGSNARPALA